jgi:hypothetical protein
MICNKFTFPFYNIQFSGGYPNNLVKFGKDNYGNFSKYMGKPCSGSLNISFPNYNANNSMYFSNNTFSFNPQQNFDEISWQVLEQFGILNQRLNYFEGSDEYCLLSAVKFGTLFIGPQNPLSIKSMFAGNFSFQIPNPISNQLMIPDIGNGTVYLINSLGQVVLTKNIESGQSLINIHEYSTGMYLLKIKTSDFNFTKKLIIQH